MAWHQSIHLGQIIIWFGMGLCITKLSLRLTIRIICFQRLFVEDYLMGFALSITISTGVVLHTYLADIYLTSLPQEATGMSPGDYLSHVTVVWRVDGVAIILLALGIWTIKINFMLIFYRLGHQIRAYATFWWASVVVIVACGAVLLGILPYDCMFEDSGWVNAHCSTASKMSYIYSVYEANVAVDVVSDFIIIVFPISILWNAGISLCQKLVLSSIFSLVAFTIAVTIVRGSIFFGVYKSGDDASRKGLDPSWMVFWWFIELIVSFVVACLVSFRSLWTNMRQDNKKRRIQLERQRAKILTQQAPDRIRSLTAIRTSSALGNRWGRLLDTLADLEGTMLERNMPQHLPITVPSGELTVDFSQFGSVQLSTSEAKPPSPSHSSHGSTVNGSAASVTSEYAREPQALVEESNLLHHAKPPPSYHRPGAAG
ncbi:hypothetical protein FJTKL_14409 [Diaporthe vaccinii]|uniref:Rhodopsin domain-containing protein n=1 Tax=Diaporthe vaccinii TaxID=105482 RepID=A0ABR4E7S8_9PEZI